MIDKNLKPNKKNQKSSLEEYRKLEIIVEQEKEEK